MDIEIRQCRSQQLGSIEALVECCALVNLLNHLLWHNLARLIVDGVLLKHLLRECPVLHKLRWKLHEVALNTCQTTILHISKEVVQCVTKLVEKGLHLVNREQCRTTTYGWGEVTYDANHRAYTLAILIRLIDIGATPRTALLAGTRMEIEVESTEWLVVAINNLIHLTLWVIYRSLQWAECDTEQTVGKEEDTTLGILQREVCTHLLLLKLIIGYTHLLGVVPPVPRLKLCILAVVLLKEWLHTLHLALCLLQSRSPHTLQKLIHSLWLSCHLVGCDIVGVRVITQQLRLLVTQAYHLGNHRVIIVLIAVVTTHKVSLVDLLTQVTILGVGQEWQHT